ncbi:MAG: hypothetical protein WC534_02750 [Candidatus Paceibacterota bacterium]
MNWTTWMILWFIAALPLGKVVVLLAKIKAKEMAISALKGVIIFLFGFLLIVLNISDSGMWWFWLILIALSVTVDLITEEHLARFFTLAATIILVIAAIIVLVLSGVNNAAYFDSFISKSDGFPIQNEIPDNMIRLTTQELAESIAHQHMGEFGSASEIVSSHIALLNDNRLYWLETIANKESWGLTYRTAGMIAIDANDPDRPVKVIKERFNVAEGLSFMPLLGANGNSFAKGYYGINTANNYGDAYAVTGPNNTWSLVLTAYHPDMNFVRRYDGVYQIDQHGEVVDHLKKDIPSWMIKPYDEQAFLEQGIQDWGSHKRGDSFDFWAGGFLSIPPSNDRLEMNEDTRFIYDPDTNQIVAMVMVNPIRDSGSLSLAGAFKATSEGITYYDLRNYDLMSGVTASGVVKSKITARSGSNYYTACELLYPIKVNNETKYAWFVPIYYQNAANNQIGLAGLGIVDAQSADKVVVEYTGEGISGEGFIKKTKESFQALYGQNENTVSYTGAIDITFLSRYDPYVTNGNTREWIIVSTVSGERTFLVQSELLSDQTMLKIQQAKPGDVFALEIDGNVVKKIT